MKQTRLFPLGAPFDGRTTRSQFVGRLYDIRWSKSLVTAHKFIQEAETMAKTPKVMATAESNKGFTEFVNFSPPEDTAELLEEHFRTPEPVWDALSLLLTTGYRVGFSYNAHTGSIICSVTCRNDESVNKGKTMTSFAGDWYDSLRVALLKHFILLKGDWTIAESPAHRPLFG